MGSLFILLRPINLICRCQFCTELCTSYYVQMSKPRLLWCAAWQKYVRCSPSFCKKIFSAHRRIADAASLVLVVGKWLWLLSWSKISTRERKCDKQSVALWTLCEAFFSRGHCGVTPENSFFFCNPKIFEAYNTVCCKIAEKVSF